jgi:hypothetical protein
MVEIYASDIKLRGFSPLASDLRLSAKLMPTSADRGVSRGQPCGSPRP